MRLTKQIVSREMLLRYLALAAAVIIVSMALLFREEITSFKRFSYTGIFLLNLIGSAAIVVPVLGLPSVCAGGSILGLNPILVALVAGVAETLGESSGYALGFGGRAMLGKNNLYQRFERWVRRKGGLVLFVASVIPNPAFDLIGIAAGALRYPLYWFFPIIWVGKTIKALGIVYACILGAEGIVNLFGSG